MKIEALLFIGLLISNGVMAYSIIDTKNKICMIMEMIPEKYEDLNYIYYREPNMDFIIDNNENITLIWFNSDPHFIHQYCTTIDEEDWNDAIFDAIKMKTDYAFNIGDITNWYNDFQDVDDWTEAWNIFKYNPNYIYGWKSLENYTNGCYYIVGNHDANWYNYFPQPLNYTVQIGNILFIIIGDESPPKIGHEVPDKFGQYQSQVNFVNKTIQNNQDKNIFIICHYPLQDTVWNTNNNYSMDDENNELYVGMLNYLEKHNMSPIGWFSGHAGVSPERYNNIYKYGIYHFNVLSISLAGEPVFMTHNSIFMFITDNSDKARIKPFNHDNNCFIETKYYPITFNLKYEYEKEVR